MVLIAGKGHETYQQIGNETFDFDDAEVAGRAIVELNKSKTGKSVRMREMKKLRGHNVNMINTYVV